MGRSPCCDENGLKKGPWTPEEDQKLSNYIRNNGIGSWGALPKRAGLNRCGKSCRLRWINYLRPDIRRGNFSEDEERIIINLHKALGNKWSKIASKLPGRTDNEIKNYWNTHMRKKLLQMGIDPVTHKPRTEMNQFVNLSQWLYAAQLGNLITTPWENSVMLHADAADVAKLQLLQNLLQVINANSLSNMSFPNTQLSGLLSGQNTSYNNENFPFIPTAPQSLSHDQIPQLSTQCQDPSNSWSCLDGTFDKQGQTLNSNHLSNSYGIMDQADPNHLPPLVSASSEDTCTKKDLPQSITNPGECSSSPSFDAWDKLIDDESSEAYWKEVLDLASSLPSPL